jgi:NADPH-dependent 2,4-dienoyl-CoA reductase/sulfur reductase-like enzyme
MMAEAVDLAIVGAGPAGLSAAAEAAALGLSTALVDAYPRPGGQYFKQLPAEFRAKPAADRHVQQLLVAAEGSEVRLLADTSAWGIFPAEDGEGFLLCLYGPPDAPRRLRAARLVLAPGAYDRPVPFPGWTLPGVMTAGAVQVLLKSQRVLPGRRVLLSGTGPLQVALASQLVCAGAQVVAILDANPFPLGGWRQAHAVWRQWQRLREGWDYVWCLRKAGVPIRWGFTVASAEGTGRLERLSIGPVAGGAAEEVAVDLLCLGFGLVPAVQLSAQAGCEHEYRPGAGGWIPRRDEWLQTTLPGLFVAGDGAGIGGKDVALFEGRLAAMAAARQLGCRVAADRVETVRRALARQRRFATLLSELFPFPPGLWQLMTDDTVLCRCEEVTVGEVRRAAGEGVTTPNAVKGLTRAGMGRCQGRMCQDAIAHVVARATGRPVEEVGKFTPRPPVLPIPLEGLLSESRR